ncbi:unnamed protein product [Penicillium glandicola]
MAKDQTTPTLPKSAKAGVAKRTAVKTSPRKASFAHVDKDTMFLWKCIKLSPGFKPDWVAVGRDAGKPAGTVQKQYSRLNRKLEEIAAAEAAEEESGEDAAEEEEDE